MKKLTTVIAAMALFFIASAFTPDPDSNEVIASLFNTKNAKAVKAEKLSTNVTKAFDQKYAKAENVNWKQNESLYFADFELNKKPFTVAYTENGDLFAICRRIQFDQLPIVVTDLLADEYADYKLPTNVTEIVMEGSTSYYLIAEGKSNYLQLKCSPDGNISIDKKIKKKVLVGSVL